MTTEALVPKHKIEVIPLKKPHSCHSAGVPLTNKAYCFEKIAKIIKDKCDLSDISMKTGNEI